MERNSIVEGLVIVLVILLIVFLISRNRKDQKTMEDEITKSEIDPKKHDDKHV
jgi:preprotein translocase subunit YajC